MESEKRAMRPLAEHMSHYGRRYLFSFLLLSSATCLLGGLVGRMGWQLGAMFAITPLLAIVGFSFEHQKEQKPYGLRVAEIAVAIVVGLCAIVLGVYGFVGMY